MSQSFSSKTFFISLKFWNQQNYNTLFSTFIAGAKIDKKSY